MRGLRLAIPVIRPSIITDEPAFSAKDRPAKDRPKDRRSAAAMIALIRIRPKAKPGSSRTGLRGEEGGPARARRRAWFIAREAGIDERLADRQLRRSRPIFRRRGRL